MKLEVRCAAKTVNPRSSPILSKVRSWVGFASWVSWAYILFPVIFSDRWLETLVSDGDGGVRYATKDYHDESHNLNNQKYLWTNSDVQQMTAMPNI